eukprot:8464805-Pyramimonas_sp.AAC.1
MVPVFNCSLSRCRSRRRSRSVFIPGGGVTRSPRFSQVVASGSSFGKSEMHTASRLSWPSGRGKPRAPIPMKLVAPPTN